MSVELNLPSTADVQLIVTALHIAGGALPADHLTRNRQDRKHTSDEPGTQFNKNTRARRSEAQERCLRLAYEMSAELLALQHRQKLARIASQRSTQSPSRPTPHPTAEPKPLPSPPNDPRMTPNAQV